MILRSVESLKFTFSVLHFSISRGEYRKVSKERKINGRSLQMDIASFPWSEALIRERTLGTSC